MNNNYNKPNFFIVGGPKCGTTALRSYLKEHSKIFMSEPKEPHYFNDDFKFGGKRKFDNEKKYLETCFKNSSKYDHIGEASPWYLYSSTAIQNIEKFNNQAKYIVLLRNPVEMFQSLFYQYKYRLYEDVNTPKEAWELQEARKDNYLIPKYCVDKKILQYGEVCSLGKQLKRLCDIVDRNRVLIIFSEDLMKNTEMIYDSVLKFLGVENDGRKIFPKINLRKKNKFIFINVFLKKVILFKKKINVNFGLGLGRLISKFNRVEFDKETISIDFNTQLIKYFEDDIKIIESVTGKDLSLWYKVK